MGGWALDEVTEVYPTLIGAWQGLRERGGMGRERGAGLRSGWEWSSQEVAEMRRAGWELRGKLVGIACRYIHLRRLSAFALNWTDVCDDD